MTAERAWPGYNAIRYLVVFGDSYSQTVYPGVIQPQPTPGRPLGVDWPGCTYNEDDKPNWVGHLVQKRPDDPLLVWSYATGGAQVTDVRWQVNQRFLKHLPRPFARTTAESSKHDAPAEAFRHALFSVFVGINDVCYDIDARIRVSLIFQCALLPLYEKGARNFIVFNNPSRIRPSKDYRSSASYMKHENKIAAWNAALTEQLDSFEQAHTDATIVRIDSWKLFSDVFESPESYDFRESDIYQAYGGDFWMDGLHPASAVHEIIANRVSIELSKVQGVLDDPAESSQDVSQELDQDA